MELMFTDGYSNYQELGSDLVPHLCVECSEAV
jgi:hypothetical protein